MPTDIEKGLPIRSKEDADERVQVKHIDFTNPALGQQVDADGNAHVELHGNKPNGDDVVLALSELGRPNGDGFYVAGASGNTKPASVGLVAHTRGASPTEADQILRLTAAVTGIVKALDIALHDENAVPYGINNPLPVFPVENADSDPVHDFDDSGAIPGGGTDDHDYTVPVGKILLLDGVNGSSSGRGRIDLLVNAVQKASSRNSVSDPDYKIDFKTPIEVAAGVLVKVIRTNQENQAKSTETTIIGKLIDA
jgi:hypothetical protein